jgi:hypothetical protein
VRAPSETIIAPTGWPGAPEQSISIPKLYLKLERSNSQIRNLSGPNSLQLSMLDEDLAMVRVIVITLIMLAAFDHFSTNGRYTSAAMQASSQILHGLRVI